MSLPGTVFAEPPYVPPPVDPDFGWSGLDMTWTGANGTAFSLVSQRDGLIVGRGVRGIGNPSFTHFRDESPALAGSRWRGYNTQQRTVNWPVRLFHDSGTDAFVERWNAFWDTLKPHAPGVWSVRSPNGIRTLRCRYEKGGEEAFDMDPTFFGWAPFALELTAEEPFWQGATIPYKWGSETARDFFDPAGSPPLWISDTTTLGETTITNPGDEPAYVVWRVYGPTTSVTIQIGSQSLIIPFAIPDGGWVTIDTRPTEQTAIDFLGVDRTSELGAFGFVPVPSGVDRDITITMAGNGRIEADLTPQYWRAF